MRRLLVILGLLLLAAFVIVAAGAYPRYNRVVYGGPLLVLALALLGAAGFRRQSRTATWAAAACGVMAAAALVVWFRPSLVDARPFDPPMRRTHVFLTLEPDRLRAALADELQPVDLPDCRLERFGER